MSEFDRLPVRPRCQYCGSDLKRVIAVIPDTQPPCYYGECPRCDGTVVSLPLGTPRKQFGLFNLPEV